MLRNLVLTFIVASLALPAASLAAKPAKYKVGQACSTKKESTYLKHHFTCVAGHLKVKK